MSRRRIEPPFKWNVDLEAEFERIVEKAGQALNGLGHSARNEPCGGSQQTDRGLSPS